MSNEYMMTMLSRASFLAPPDQTDGERKEGLKGGRLGPWGGPGRAVRVWMWMMDKYHPLTEAPVHPVLNCTLSPLAS